MSPVPLGTATPGTSQQQEDSPEDPAMLVN